MSSSEAADRRKRDRKSTHKEKKRKKSRPSPGVDVEKGDGEVIKLKVEHGLLEELQLTSITTFPKPLREFIEDRSKLLDEVFTVLSRDDIEGMLPDILKGLRMKRIKELCGEQLAKLDDNAVVRILSGHEESMPPTTVQQPAPHRTPVAPLGGIQISSISCSSSLHKTEFSDVSDQEQQPENSSAKLKVAAALSDEVGSGSERQAWTDVREEGDGGETTKSMKKAAQWTIEDPPGGGCCDVGSDEDGLDINTAITDIIDMELAGEVPSHESRKQAPPVSKTLQPAQKIQQHKKKKHKTESHTVSHSTSSDLTCSSSLESKLRRKLLTRVQHQDACNVSDETGKQAGTPTSDMAIPAADSTVAPGSHELELCMKEKALKSLLTKSLRKRVL